MSLEDELRARVTYLEGRIAALESREIEIARENDKHADACQLAYEFIRTLPRRFRCKWVAYKALSMRGGKQ
jgi:hypothetical protein